MITYTNKRDQRQLQPYCTGQSLFVSRYVQLMCLTRLLTIVAVNLNVMMTEGEENPCVRED